MEKKKGKIRLNILAINFPEDKQHEIRSLVEKEGHFADFCLTSGSYEKIISVFPDYIIAYAHSAVEIQNESFEKISKTADEFNIPLVVVESSGSGDAFYVQINNSVSNMIVSPFGKNFFFKYIDEIIRYLSEKNRVILNADTSILINSLLSTLISQKRLDIDSVTEKDILRQPENNNLNREKRDLEARLWTALENSMFRLHYQPVMSLEQESVSGFEALIRMTDYNGTLIFPDKFIDVAEESALIFPLGLWIVEEACRQINEWKNKFHLATPFRVNVNISPRQFIFPDLTRSIFEITEKYAVGPGDIAFEITESALMGDMESANIALLEFRAKNFMLYMDDFGTGYSSLSYLMHFPVNTIKIDQSFVKWMHIDDQSEIIVKSIISLAHNLGLKVVAEGTDDQSHIELLKDFGCDYAQGYYFSKPLSPADAEVFLEKYFKRK